MKRNFLKRTMALAVAVAVTVSSVPVDLAFAEEMAEDMEEVILPEEDMPVVAEVEDETAPEEVQAQPDGAQETTPVDAAQEPAVDEEAVSFIAGIEEIDSVAVPAEVAQEAEAEIAPISLAAPFKVSDLRVENDMLYWHVDEAYEGYEFDVTDGTYSYFSGLDDKGNPIITSISNDDYWSYNDEDGDCSTYVGNLIRTAYAKNAAGAWEQVKDPAKPEQLLSSLRDGVTYSISVRAIGTNGAKSETVGPVTYTYKKEEQKKVTTPGTPTSLRQAGSSLKWDAPATGEVDRYRIRVTDENGNRYGSYECVSSYYDTEDEEYVDVYKFEDRSWYGSGGSVQVYLSDLRYSLRAYANVKDDAEVTEEPDALRDEKGNTIYAFAPGKKYSIQVYAENWGYDENEKYVELKGTPTAAITVQFGTAPGKVEGLTLDETSLSWNEVDDMDPMYGISYEVVVTDAAGKEVGRRVTNSTYVDIEEDIGIEDEYGDWYEIDYIPGEKYTITVRARKMIDEDYDEDTYQWIPTYLYGEAATVVYSEDTVRNGGSVTPDTVTGLVVKTDNADVYDGGGVYRVPQIAWNEMTGASIDRYDIQLTDAAGNAYYSDYTVTVNQDNSRTEEKTYISVEYNYVNASYFESYNAYTLPAGASLTKVTGAAGEFLTGFDAGQTYTVSVRAVDEYQEYDKEKGWTDKELTGAWSAPQTYQIGTLTPVTGLKYVPDTTGKKSDAYYFSFDAGVKVGTVYYQYSTDPKFATNCSGWLQGTDDTYKLSISKTIYGLRPDTTYYVRAFNAFAWAELPTDEEADELMAANPGMVTSFTTDPVPATAKTITGFRLEKEEANYFEFVFDAVLDDEDRYELQYSADGKEWISLGETTILYKSELKDGATYQVRAVAYVKDRDNINKIYGKASGTVSVSVNRAAGDVTGFAVKTNQYGYVFTYTNAFRNGETVKLQVADSKDFVENGDRTMIYDGWISNVFDYDQDDDSYVDFYSDIYDTTLSYSQLTPGKTYYARARVYSEGAEDGKQYGRWSNVITINPKVVKISVVTKGVSSNELYLSMGLENDEDYLSGYQIQRKSGKKWKTLTYTTDDVYKDTGLKSLTRYQYRVRPYYYDAAKKTYVYGSYEYCEAVTWGNALNLKAKAVGKTSVKLSWNKVSGAKGYEIYRRVTSSAATASKAGHNDSFSSWRLIKTIKKASTKSYTNKKLTSGVSYDYMVRAYKTINKKKYYISEQATVDLSMKSFTIIDQTSLTSGKLKVTWNPIYTATGYLIEKKDNETNLWSTVAEIKKAKTSSYTLPASDDNDGILYRIRAYKGDEYSNAGTVRVYPYLSAPTGVKAEAQADGSVKITWNKVSGADYYEVHRTTSSWSKYNKDLKTYSYAEGITLKNYVADETTLSGYRVADPDELTETTLYDRPVSYTTAAGVTNTLWAGPKADVKYYYYVVARRKGTEYIKKDGSNEDTIGQAKSAPGKAASATVATTEIAKPTKVKAKASKGKVKVSWKSVSGAKGYVVYRSTKKKSGYVPVGYISSGKTKSYTDKTVKKRKTYYYKVRAFKVNAAGAYVYSKDSSAKKVKAK